MALERVRASPSSSEGFAFLGIGIILNFVIIMIIIVTLLIFKTIVMTFDISNSTIVTELPPIFSVQLHPKFMVHQSVWIMIGNWNIWNNLPTAESTEVHYACLQDPCNLMQVKNRFQLFVEKKNAKKSSCHYPHCYKPVPKVGKELSRKPYSIAVRKGSTLKDQLNSM